MCIDKNIDTDIDTHTHTYAYICIHTQLDTTQPNWNEVLQFVTTWMDPKRYYANWNKSDRER